MVVDKHLVDTSIRVALQYNKYELSRNLMVTNSDLPPEPGFSVANDPSNNPISQKIAKNVVSEKPK